MSDLLDSIPDDQAAPHIDPTSPELCNSSLTSPRAIVYHYALQEALWHHLWLVNASKQSPGASMNPTAFNITQRLELAKKDGIEVPPMFITNGTKDDKVDSQGAERLVRHLERDGVVHEWDEREGLDHLFDQSVDEKMDRMHVFLKRWLL
jgi:hypothetical protein